MSSSGSESEDEITLELQALQSIMGSDFTSQNNNKRKFQLHVKPTSEEAKNFVYILLDVSLPSSYPTHAADFRIDQSRGLNTAQKHDVMQIILSTSRELVEEPMVYDVYQAVKDFLVEHNKPETSLWESMNTQHDIDHKEKLKAQQEAEATVAKRERQKEADLARQIGRKLKGGKPMARMRTSSFDVIPVSPMVSPTHCPLPSPTKQKKAHRKKKHRDRADSGCNNNATPTATTTATPGAADENFDRELQANLAQFNQHLNVDDFGGFKLNLMPPPNTTNKTKRSGSFMSESEFTEDSDSFEHFDVSTEDEEEDTYHDIGAYPDPHTLDKTDSQMTTDGKGQSRFYADFEELDQLGRGGFGEVVKARNKLDGRVYAVKQVRLGNDPVASRKIIREVSTIAMLHHRYIVRYFHAWIEDGDAREMYLEGDSEDEDWLTATFSASASASHSDHPDADMGSRSLYIQMEYCTNKTLKSIIEEKLCHSAPAAVWRLFRQILEGIAFIHKKGIIHRDMKPPNVFIDANGNIKLGDFGLAVLRDSDWKANPVPDDPVQAAVQEPAGDQAVPPFDPDSGDLTEVVGTPFYRSPEQEAVGVEYGYACDMYALGIIFFEMWHPFSTGMERATTLIELRKTGKVPAHFMPEVLVAEDGDEASSSKNESSSSIADSDNNNNNNNSNNNSNNNVHKTTTDSEDEEELEEKKRVARERAEMINEARPAVVKIIEWLLQANARARPTAESLLKSGLVPLKVEDEYLEVAIQNVTQTTSPLHPLLIDTLFSAEATDVVDFTYDFVGHSAAHEHKRLAQAHVYNRFRHNVFDVARVLFQLHGAVHIETPILIPYTARVHRGKETRFMDESGVVMQLPYTLTIPFARYVVQHATTTLDVQLGWQGNSVLSVNNAKTIALDLRRYDIAKVYRPTPGGGKPRELWECDFDIVWPEGKGQNEVKRSRIKTKKSHGGGGKKQKRNVYAKKTLLIHEVITALDTFIDKFSVALGTCTIRVNHWSLLRSAIRCILGHERYIENTSTSAAQGNNNNNNTGNTAEAFYSELVDYVCDVVVVTLPVAAAASRWRHSQARTRFLAEKRISERAIRELGALFNLCSSLQSVDQITTQLKAIADSSVNKSFSTKATEDFRAALDEVTALFILLEESTCKYDVVLDLGLVGSGEVFSSDFLVQVYRLVPHDQESSHRHGHHRYEVLAVGGCYDQLLRSLKPPNSPGSRLCGLGVNIAIDKIVQCVFKQQVLISGKKHKKSNRQLAPVVLKPQQDLDGVLLFGSKNSLQEERMTVASKLWKRGVRADYLYPKDLSFAGVRRYCNELRLRWVFLFKSKLFDAKPSSVLVYDMKETKVKDSNTNTTQLEVANIPQFLRQQSSASGGKSHTEHTKQSLHSFPITLVEYSKPLNSYRKQQVIDTCARVLKGVFAQEGNFSVVCAELPLLLIRKYTQGVLELGSHSDVYKLVGFTQVAGKDKQHVQAVAEMVKHEHAKGYDVIVVFSTTELKYDLVNLS